MNALVEYCNSGNCVGAQLFAGEKYCPWCGAPRKHLLVAVEELIQDKWVSLERSILESENVKLRLRLECAPGSQESICVTDESFRIEAPWLVLDKISSLPGLSANSSLELKRYEPRYLNLMIEWRNFRFDTKVLAGKINVRPFILKENASPELSRISELSVVGIIPKPVLQAFSSTKAYFRPEKDTTLTVPFRVVVSRAKVRIIGFAVEATTHTPAELSSSLVFSGNLPVVIQPGAANGQGGYADFSVSLPAEYVSQLDNRSKIDIKCNYEILLGYQDKSVAVSSPLSLSITFRERPSLSIKGFVNGIMTIELVKTGASCQDLVLKLYNSGENGSVLNINNCSIVQTSDAGTQACAGVSLALAANGNTNCFPLQIKSGESKSLILKLNDFMSLAPKLYCYELRFVTDDPQCPVSVFTVQADVLEMQTNEAVLAVDFGTSASCAAVCCYRSSVLIDVDDDSGIDRKCAPSYLEYRRYGEPGAGEEVLLGSYALAGAFDRPLATIVSPKRNIAEDASFRVTPSSNSRMTPHFIPVQKVVSHVYRHIANSVKQAVILHQLPNLEPCQCLFNTFVITHPSRFSCEQIKIIKNAATEAFSKAFSAPDQPGAVSLRTEPVIYCLQEPVAAAYHFLDDIFLYKFLFERIGNAEKPDELSLNLLVYDCGGGTTDLSLIKLHCKRNKLRSLSRPDNLESAYLHGDVQLLWPKFIVNTVRELVDHNTSTKEPLKRFSSIETDRLASCLVHAMKEAGNQKDDIFFELARGGKTVWSRITEAVKENDRLDVNFSLSEFNEKLLALVQDYCSNVYHYAVTLTLTGAWGDQHFGGECMTEVVREQIEQIIADTLKDTVSKDTAAVDPNLSELSEGWSLISDQKQLECFCSKLMADRLRSDVLINNTSLSFWSEYIKCHLNDSCFELPKSISETPGRLSQSTGASARLKLFKQGSTISSKETHLLDLLNGRKPLLQDVCAKLDISLQRTAAAVVELVNNALDTNDGSQNEIEKANANLDVILLTGRASRWPQVSQTLSKFFPHPYLYQPFDGLKECVVDGAAQYVDSTLNMMGAAQTTPGVAIAFTGSVSFTTSRIGTIQQNIFSEIIPASLQFVDGQVGKTVPWIINGSGRYKLKLYENCSSDNIVKSVIDDANIRKFRDLFFDIPTNLDFRDSFSLALTIKEDLQLTAVLTCLHEDQVVWSQTATG